MKNHVLLSAILILFLSVIPGISTAQDLPVVYVTQNGSGDGSSWDNALSDLQEAINLHDSAEVWVAAGTYAPTQFPPFTRDQDLDNDHYKSIYVIKDVSLYGGFSGNETDRSQRDWNENITTLDGEEYYYHVVQMRGENSQDEDIEFGINSTTVFDGFTITRGLNTSSGDGNQQGAGMVISYSSPQVKNCTFTQNNTFDVTSSGGYGGAMKLFASDARITSCVFDKNTAFYGGAIHMSGLNNPVIEYNTFINNNSSTGGQGGAIYIEGFSSLHSKPIIRNNIFRNNIGGDGGAIFSMSYVHPIILNNVFTGNLAHQRGGGLFIINANDEAIVMNNSFGYNRAKSSGGGVNIHSSELVFSNNIVWDNYNPDDNSVSEINISESDITYSYNIVRGYNGTGSNYGNSPQFLDDDLHISFDSPAIDAGKLIWYTIKGIADTLYDAEGNERIRNGKIDVGAYERTPFSADENGIIYVDAEDGSANGTGNSWQNANINLGIALDFSDGAEQIWVANGTYYTFRFESSVSGNTEAQNATLASDAISLQMKNGLTLAGGFEGNEPADFNLLNRDLENNESIITGTLMVGRDSVNYTSVLFYNADANLNTIDSTAVIDGFVLENAGGNGIQNGALLNGGNDMVEASPIIRNTVFRNSKGWGIYNHHSQTKIENCVFENISDDIQYSDSRGGGGIYNKNAVKYGEKYDLNTIRILNCEFRNNNLGVLSETYGPMIMGSTFEDQRFYGVSFNRAPNHFQTASSVDGWIIDSEFRNNGWIGIKNYRMSPVIKGCHFEDNNSTTNTKAIFNQFVKDAAETAENSKSVKITDCMFQGNSTDVSNSFSKVTVGNSIFNKTQYRVFENSSTIMDVVNSTFVNQEEIFSYPITNSVSEYQDLDTTATLTISNSIFWNLRMTNTGEIEIPFLFGWSSKIDTSLIKHSVIQGGDADLFYGEGMMFEDPMFLSEYSFSLNENSPLIDAGNDELYTNIMSSETDFAGHDRMNGTIDIGALEYHQGLSIEDEETNGEIPNGYKLKNAYPNPFNPSTNIAFDLPRSGFVTLSVYNILGQKVATLISKQMSAGSHIASFEAHGLSSGIYLYRIQVNDFVSQKQMTLIK